MDTVQDYFAVHGALGEAQTITLLHDRLSYRSVFVSDLHIGTSGCLAGDFVRFLKHLKTDYLYLVGDVFDCWQLGVHRRRELGRLFDRYYSQDQNTALRKIMRMADHGTRVILIPGNHDEVLRDFVGQRYGNTVVMFDAAHRTADGRHYAVTHGDSFDPLIRHHRLLGIWGTQAYEMLARANLQIDRWRKNGRVNTMLDMVGLTSRWSLAHKIKTASDEKTYTAQFERAMVAHLFHLNKEIAQNRRHVRFPAVEEPFYDGVICGHTHLAMERWLMGSCAPQEKQPGLLGLHYLNTGHWTGPPQERSGQTTDCAWRDGMAHPTCTAVVEDAQGHLSHVRWDPARGIVPCVCSKA